MSSAKPTRKQADLAEVLELVLDKGIVINADITITVGDTEMLGIELRAAIASFETAAEYGLAFPSGTDMQRVEQASGREPLDEGIDLGIEASTGADSETTTHDPPSRRPHPSIPFGAVEEDAETEDEEEADTEEDEDVAEAGEDNAESGAETDEGRSEEDEAETDEDGESAESTPDTGTTETDSEDS